MADPTAGGAAPGVPGTPPAAPAPTGAPAAAPAASAPVLRSSTIQPPPRATQAVPAAAAPVGPPYNYKLVLQQMVQQNASDLHLKVGRPPTIRIDGELDLIEEGTVEYGMQSFDQSLMAWYSRGVISYDDALFHATNPGEFALRSQGVDGGNDTSWNGFGRDGSGA